MAAASSETSTSTSSTAAATNAMPTSVELKHGWGRARTVGALPLFARPHHLDPPPLSRESKRHELDMARCVRFCSVAIPALATTLPLTAESGTAIEARVADKAGPPGHNDDFPAPRQSRASRASHASASTGRRMRGQLCGERTPDNGPRLRPPDLAVRPNLDRPDAAIPAIAFDVPSRRVARLLCREAVGISVPSDRFMTLPGWLEISFRVSVVSCC
jgi:hypothetical protein